jgi:hypothetical protein
MKGLISAYKSILCLLLALDIGWCSANNARLRSVCRPKCSGCIAHCNVFRHPWRCLMSRCTLIDDTSERLQMLQNCLGILVGQEEAVEEFRRLVIPKLLSVEARNLVVLIAGDSGTGKTSMGVALSLAMSSSTGRSPIHNGGDCLVLIDCGKYRYPFNSTHAHQMINEIENNLAQRLLECPESVILG